MLRNFFYNSFALYGILIIIPTLFAIILYRLIPIQNVNPISIVSVTSSINLLLWTLVIIQIIFNYFLIIKNYSIKTVIEINLFSFLVYVSTFKILIKALSLKGTPLPGSDIRGDLLRIVNLAKIAERTYWSGPEYPPLWPSMIGNAARILEVDVLPIFKPAEFILLALAPVLILALWRLVVENWIAVIITLNQVLIYDFNYSSLALNLLIPTLVYVIMAATKANSSEDFRFYFWGIISGVISLLYFGYLYWLAPLLFLIGIVVFISKKRLIYSRMQAFYYLGLCTALGPIIYIEFFDSITIFYLLVLAALIVLVSVKKLKIVSKLLFYLGNIVGLLGLTYVFFSYRIPDSWFYGDIEKNNPTVESIIDLSGINLAMLFLVVFGIYYIIKSGESVSIVAILGGMYLSSTIFMYFIASQMQITSRVDLWPRAQSIQSYTLDLIFLILFILFVKSVFGQSKLVEINGVGRINLFYLAASVLFIVGSYFVSVLGSKAHGSMPYHAFTPAWYAHQGCTNPHEDPMLSKVFETHPDIQAFLRAECYEVNWPEIPKKSK